MYFAKYVNFLRPFFPHTRCTDLLENEFFVRSQYSFSSYGVGPNPIFIFYKQTRRMPGVHNRRRNSASYGKVYIIHSSYRSSSLFLSSPSSFPAHSLFLES